MLETVKKHPKKALTNKMKESGCHKSVEDVFRELEKMESVDYEKVYETIWRQIESEHNLISNRIGWYVTSQAFLLTAFGAWTSDPNYIWVKTFGIPILGILTSPIIFFPILGATITIKLWMQGLILCNKDSAHSAYLVRNIHRNCRRPWIYKCGRMAPMLYPILFFLIWIIILIVEVF